MSYKELQQALKSMRQDGYDIQVKLNSSRDVLQAELDRLRQSLIVDVPEDTAEPAMKPTVEPEKAEPMEPLVNSLEPAIAEAPLAEIQATDDSQLSTPLAQPTAIATDRVAEPLSKVAASGSGGSLRKSHKDSFWIDGTELVMHLDQTQAQAMRNLEDGFRWLHRTSGNIKAFADSFRQGWQRSHSPRDVAKVIQLDPRQRSLKAA